MVCVKLTMLTRLPLLEDMSPWPFKAIHSYGTGYGGSPPNTSRTMRLPVSYEPPRVAWSLPKGSTVTPNACQRAGQSTRQVSLPACDTGAVALCPQVQVYETVLATASKPVTRVPARRPQAAHRRLYVDESSGSALA